MESALYIVPVLLIVVVFLSTAIKVLREYERAVIFRLGRLIAAKGPGLVLLIPLVDKMVKVSLRTLALEVPPPDVITRNNVSVKVGAVVFFRVLDPRNAVVQVQDFLFATSQIAQTTLRSVLGQVELDDLLASRDKINQQLQRIIDEHTGPWGVKVTTVEVKQVDLPQDMQRAMLKQAETERERRAKVINAEGEYQAAEKLAQAARVLASNPGRRSAPVSADDAGGGLGTEHDHLLPRTHRSRCALLDRSSDTALALISPTCGVEGAWSGPVRRVAEEAGVPGCSVKTRLDANEHNTGRAERDANLATLYPGGRIHGRDDWAGILGRHGPGIPV